MKTIYTVTLGLLWVTLSSSQHPWPMFRHDRKHSGRSESTGPSTPVEQWRYLLNNTEGVSSPAVKSDGTIYVGSIGAVLCFSQN